MRSASVVLAAAMLVGCSSESGNNATSDATPSPNKKPGDSRANATADNAASQDAKAKMIDVGQQLADLARSASENESRGYFEAAIGDREKIVELVAKQYPAGSWQERTARVSLNQTKAIAGWNEAQRTAFRQANANRVEALALAKQGKKVEALAKIAAANQEIATIVDAKSLVMLSFIVDSARVHALSGETDVAIANWHRVTDVRETLLGATHPDCADGLDELGILLQQTGKTNEAETCFKSAAEKCKVAWGDKHPRYARELNNLAMLYHGQGRNDDALPLLVESATIRQTVEGNSESLAQSMFNLGSVHFAVGRYDQAETSFDEALSIYQARGQGNTPLARRAAHNLAMTLIELKKFDRAESLMKEQVSLLESTLGPNHPDAAQAKLALASVYVRSNRKEEAVTCVEQAVASYSESVGAKDPRTVQATAALEKMRR